MELTVYWTQFAEEKLEDIFHYYAFKASLQIAEKLVNELVDKSLELEKNPKMGAKEELLKDRIDDFRYLVHKNYKIIYFINTKLRRVEIVHVFDTRQNPIKISELK